MRLQKGTLIKLTDKNDITSNGMVLEQITEDHRWYFHECGYHQYLIITNNTIAFLGYFREKKSWGIVEADDFYFEDDILQHVSYRKFKVKFLEETTNKFKLLRKPPGIDRFLYIREQHQREMANKVG